MQKKCAVISSYTQTCGQLDWVEEDRREDFFNDLRQGTDLQPTRKHIQ